jgi:hypothetical protein
MIPRRSLLAILGVAIASAVAAAAPTAATEVGPQSLSGGRVSDAGAAGPAHRGMLVAHASQAPRQAQPATRQARPRHSHATRRRQVQPARPSPAPTQ